MNKTDIILSITLFIISIFIYGLYVLNSTNSNIANVYYDNDKILTIDLNNISDTYYTVKGYNGDITIESLNHKIRVVDEVSPKHLCSKEGWISNSYESIICLPNKIVINIEGSDIDTITR